MSDIQDERLEAMLRSRRVATASPDLAARIILKAQGMPQNRTIFLWQWLRQLCAESHLPKPAYVLVSALIVGLVIGFSTVPDTTPTDTSSSMHLQGFLYPDEGPL